MSIKTIIVSYVHIHVIILTVIIAVFDLYFNFFKSFCEDSSSLSALAGVNATLIGFLITGATIFLTLINKETGFIKRVKKYKHDRIFVNTVISGIIAFFLSIFSWILQDVSYLFGRLCLYSFIAGAFETIIIMYYLYEFIVYSDNT